MLRRYWPLLIKSLVVVAFTCPAIVCQSASLLVDICPSYNKCCSSSFNTFSVAACSDSTAWFYCSLPPSVLWCCRQRATQCFCLFFSLPVLFCLFSGAMCSYFAPNGVSLCGNPWLLNGMLRSQRVDPKTGEVGRLTSLWCGVVAAIEKQTAFVCVICAFASVHLCTFLEPMFVCLFVCAFHVVPALFHAACIGHQTWRWSGFQPV